MCGEWRHPHRGSAGGGEAGHYARILAADAVELAARVRPYLQG